MTRVLGFVQLGGRIYARRCRREPTAADHDRGRRS